MSGEEITVDSIDVSYGDLQVLWDVSLSLSTEDTVVALVGPNGAGKTTLLETLSGLKRPDEGSITVFDRDGTALSPEQIVKDGFVHVPEERNLFGEMSVEENLQMGAYVKRDEYEQTLAEVYTTFPILEERTDQQARTLSGGEQQMLAIARALLSDPDLILVDEPLEGLMPTLVIDILEVFTELKQQNMTMVIAEQQTDQVLELAERAYIIDKGTIAYEGTAEDLKSDRGLMEQHMGVK
jgi:branched-chain amino acid transport system ATP-binding protein